MKKQRLVWIGAAAAAAARVARRTRHPSAPEARRLTVQPTVAPELVDDLTDLLRRVMGRAASDPAGGISVNLAPGAEPSAVAQELRRVVDRWSEMHPGIRVRVAAGGEVTQRPLRRVGRRRLEAQESAADYR